MQDPTGSIPEAAFSQTTAALPGLAGAVDPKPDHGEDGYVGNGRLTGRRALITGGDSGIGRAVAIAFAREGANVVITHLPSEGSDARQVLTLMQACGVKARSIPGDVTDEAFCSRLVSEAAAFLGVLDILVNKCRRSSDAAGACHRDNGAGRQNTKDKFITHSFGSRKLRSPYSAKVQQSLTQLLSRPMNPVSQSQTMQ